MAAGGHPLPLVLRADGAVETAGSPGTLLGHRRRHRSSTSRRSSSRPATRCVLYTDGVTEADRRHRAPGRLAAFLAGCAGADAAAIAEAVEREALDAQGGRPRDDVAMLAVRVRGGPGAPFAPTELGVATAT